MAGSPSLDHERRLWADGRRHIAGIDEAGRGALAGPVVAAAVIVDPATADLPLWSAVHDSKLLTAERRAQLAPQVQAAALAWCVGCVAAEVIDQVGIAPATRLAMQQAVQGLGVCPDYLLIDWVKLPRLNIAQFACAKADQLMVSVAAASILAKVHRDTLMAALDAGYPAYGFARNKGYGAANHLAALAEHGPCPEHRCSFAPLATAPATLLPAEAL